PRAQVKEHPLWAMRNRGLAHSSAECCYPYRRVNRCMAVGADGTVVSYDASRSDAVHDVEPCLRRETARNARPEPRLGSHQPQCRASSATADRGAEPSNHTGARVSWMSTVRCPALSVRAPDSKLRRPRR